MHWNDAQLGEMWERRHETFPDSKWGMEGCGLTPDEAYELMRKSIEAGRDYLEGSFPDYPENAMHGA